MGSTQTLACWSTKNGQETGTDHWEKISLPLPREQIKVYAYLPYNQPVQNDAEVEASGASVEASGASMDASLFKSFFCYDFTLASKLTLMWYVQINE